MRVLQTPFRARQPKHLFCFKTPEEEAAEKLLAGDQGDGGGANPNHEDKIEYDPNVDLTAQFAKEKGIQPTGDDAAKKAAEAAEVERKAKETAASASAVPATEFYKPFENLSKKYQGIEIPKAEEVTAENYLDKFEETIIKNLDVSSLLDPNVAKIQAAIEAGTKWEDIVNQLAPTNTANMTDEQKVSAYYKEKYNLKDEQLPEYLPKDTGLLKKEALEADTFFKRKADYDQQQNQLKTQQEFQQNEVARKAQLEKDITVSLANFEKKTDVWGVKISDQAKAKFKTSYRNWVTQGENGEPAPIAALLNNDDFLAQVVFLADQPNVMKDFIDSVKENERQFYRSRLGLEPDFQQSGKTNLDTDVIDQNLLRAPARD